MNSKGELAEAAVRFRLLMAGATVCDPVGDRHPFDLVVVAPDGRAIKIQVKHGRVRGECVECNAHSTDHGQGPLAYHGRADAIATYVPELDRCFVIDVDAAPTRKVTLRLTPTLNNQLLRVRMAEDHTLERWVSRLSA